MKARSKSGTRPICGEFVDLEAMRTVASGVAAGVASTCASERSALEAAIAIVRFFSIQKSPIQQPDCRAARWNARSPGAVIITQTPRSAPRKRAAISRCCVCGINSNSSVQRHREFDESKSSFSYTSLGVSKPIAANAAVMMGGDSEEP